MSYQTIQQFKNQSSQLIRPTQIILHSLGNGYHWEGGLVWLLDPNNALEAHIAIRKDGLRVQLVPYTQRADANYKANRRKDGTGAISIETDSSINAEEPWTDDQVESIIELAVELCLTYDIPPILCESSTAPGIGWHIMWGSPGEWTPSSKVCPGPARINQIPTMIKRIAFEIDKRKAKSKPQTIEIASETKEEKSPDMFLVFDGRYGIYWAVTFDFKTRTAIQPTDISALQEGWRSIGVKASVLVLSSSTIDRVPDVVDIPLVDIVGDGIGNR